MTTGMLRHQQKHSETPQAGGAQDSCPHVHPGVPFPSAQSGQRMGGAHRGAHNFPIAAHWVHAQAENFKTISQGRFLSLQPRRGCVVSQCGALGFTATNGAVSTRQLRTEPRLAPPARGSPHTAPPRPRCCSGRPRAAAVRS